ncbi:MAG: helix-turn-helix transcriptional regulator [bacterium]|nr:helix-turn-helix transcriptional regulator [bacterium]
MKQKDTDYVEQVIGYIITRNDAELGELNVLNIARAFGISQSHLYNLFLEQKKPPPGQILMKMKMIRAVTLLENSENEPVNQISKKLGFSTTEYFIGIFKKHFGIPPGKFRKYLNNDTGNLTIIPKISKPKSHKKI